MPPLIDALAQCLGERTGEAVTRHQTHISWILLSGQEAWKLKKPVRLPFVDFGALEARQHYCEAEVRLNRRLAPELYLGVLTVLRNRDSGQVTVSEAAEVTTAGPAPTIVDYLVRMRRFPPGALLSERLTAGTLHADALEQLAQRLARFADSAEIQHDPTLARRVVSETAAVLTQLRAPPAVVSRTVLSGTALSRSSAGPILQALAQWLDAEAARLGPIFDARLRAGRVRDVHGDLHLANAVVVDGEVTAFDCLEFNDDLRRIDVIGDAAFLAMDLAAHDQWPLAHRLINAWCEAADDHAALAVLPFHQVYRALVRCLVATLSPAGDAASQAQRYLATARQLTIAAAEPPRLLITHGLSGSGKSWAALRFVESEGALRLRSDVERKRLAGIGPLADSAASGLALYTPAWSERTYDRLEALARIVIDAGRSAVVDAAFLKQAQRQRFAGIAAELGVGFGIVDCRADVPTLRERIERRARAGGDPSEATIAVLDRQVASLDPLTDSEQALVQRA